MGEREERRGKETKGGGEEGEAGGSAFALPRNHGDQERTRAMRVAPCRVPTSPTPKMVRKRPASAVWASVSHHREISRAADHAPM